MATCCVRGCDSSMVKKRDSENFPWMKDVTFHAFPTSDIRIQLITLVGREEGWKPTKFTRICSKHFPGKKVTLTNNNNSDKPRSNLNLDDILHLKPWGTSYVPFRKPTLAINEAQVDDYEGPDMERVKQLATRNQYYKDVFAEETIVAKVRRGMYDGETIVPDVCCANTLALKTEAIDFPMEHEKPVSNNQNFSMRVEKNVGSQVFPTETVAVKTEAIDCDFPEPQLGQPHSNEKVNATTYDRYHESMCIKETKNSKDCHTKTAKIKMEFVDSNNSKNNNMGNTEITGTLPIVDFRTPAYDCIEECIEIVSDVFPANVKDYCRPNYRYSHKSSNPLEDHGYCSIFNYDKTGNFKDIASQTVSKTTADAAVQTSTLHNDTFIICDCKHIIPVKTANASSETCTLHDEYGPVKKSKILKKKSDVIEMAPTKRRSFTAGFKLQVIAYATNHGNRAAERKFRVHERAIRNWRKQEERLENTPQTRRAFRYGKSGRKINVIPKEVTADDDVATETLNSSSINQQLKKENGKQTRMHYSGKVKLCAIFHAEQHGNRSAERKFGVPEKSVRRWRKQKEILLKTSRLRKGFSGPKHGRHPKLEDELANFVLNLKQEGCSVKAKSIQVKAREIAQKYGVTKEQFKASQSWLYKFMRRKGIS